MHIQLSKLEYVFGFCNVTLEVVKSWLEAVGLMKNNDC